MPFLQQFIDKHRLSNEFTLTAEHYYIPLAKKIATHHKSAKKTYYVGINGCQGSGKSTLADFLSAYLSQKSELNVVVLSLDDFYLDQAKRQQLAAQYSPLFTTRGVPGTHDTRLMSKVLTELGQQHHGVAIPRFNKAIDNPYPKSQWPTVNTPVDIVIFEGWCWGVEAQSEQDLSQAVNLLEAQHDSHRQWRNYVNQQLIDAYQPLYDMMDYWLMLQAPSFSNVFNWRLEQEQKLAEDNQTTKATGVMNTEQIQRFIQFYQRLTEHALRDLPAKCHEVFKLDPARKIVAHIEQTNEVKTS